MTKEQIEADLKAQEQNLAQAQQQMAIWLERTQQTQGVINYLKAKLVALVATETPNTGAPQS